MRWASLFLLATAPLGCRVLPDKALSVPSSEVMATGFSGPPKIRFGTYPTATVGTFFLGPNLGRHGYRLQPGEKNGVSYTCRGGHIDIIHVRIAADWTAYLATETFQTLMSGKPGFSYKLAVDRSHNYVSFTYPPDWDRLSHVEREATAREMALAIGPYLSYTMTTWHEILTWFGFRCIGVATEFPSAFSWEDSYSNLIGTRVAVRALQDTRHRYNEAIEIAIDEEMKALGIQPAGVARRATERVKGEWFTGSVLFFVNIKKRNFDVGLDDGYVTPTLLPGPIGCPTAAPLSYPAPTLHEVSRRGFSVQIETRSKEWERDKIFWVLFGDRRDRRVQPIIHIPLLMEHVRRDAVARYNYMTELDDSPHWARR